MYLEPGQPSQHGTQASRVGAKRVWDLTEQKAKKPKTDLDVMWLTYADE